jgi:hypothetical protein
MVLLFQNPHSQLDGTPAGLVYPLPIACETLEPFFERLDMRMRERKDIDHGTCDRGHTTHLRVERLNEDLEIPPDHEVKMRVLIPRPVYAQRDNGRLRRNQAIIEVHEPRLPSDSLKAAKITIS